jgi:hypothetical protein
VRRDLPILASGLFTTGLAFATVWWLDQDGGYVMGWYLDLVLPVGALLIGLIASVGYGASAWWLQRKISGPLLWTMVGLLVAGYFAAHYLEYRLTAEHNGFLRYFDQTTRGFSVEHDNFGQRPKREMLEQLGYGVRLLELAGFVGGGLILPLVLRKRPYCDPCRRYKTSKIVGIVPGADRAAHSRLQKVVDGAATGDFNLTARAIVSEAPLSQRSRIEDELPEWLSLNLVYCSLCADGGLARKAHHRRPKKVTLLGTTPLARSLVKEFLSI